MINYRVETDVVLVQPRAEAEENEVIGTHIDLIELPFIIKRKLVF